MFDVAAVQATGVPNMDRACLPVASDLVPDAWDKMFRNYFDHECLLQGVLYGWDLSFTSPPRPRDTKRNHPSALAHMADVDNYIHIPQGTAVWGTRGSPPRFSQVTDKLTQFQSGGQKYTHHITTQVPRILRLSNICTIPDYVVFRVLKG